MTRSPSVMRPATTPAVARYSIATSPIAMISCWPPFSSDSVVCAFSRAVRSRCRLSS